MLQNKIKQIEIKFKNMIMLIFIHFCFSYVGKWMSRKERLEQLGDQPRKFTNVYVKNFNDDTNEEELRKMFEPYGDIQSLKVMIHDDGRSKCFGFVSFSDPDSALKVSIKRHLV